MHHAPDFPFMKTEGTTANYVSATRAAGTTPDVTASQAASLPTASKTVPGLTVQSTTVTLSGRSIMLSRLFNTQNADAQPSILTSSAGLTSETLSQSPAGFLNEQDRALVSDMYAYAQQQGSDLTYVDTFAITLGTYRKFDDGKTLGGFNESQFDAEGHQLSASYNASDTAVANEILNGDAINSTRVDTGFLRYILQPTHSLSNMANIDFMQQMVTRFSDEGSDTMTLDPKFATFSRTDSAAGSVMISASKDTINQPPASQIANINGHWFILDPSMLEHPARLHDAGLDASELTDATKNAGIVALAMLDTDPDTPNTITAQLLALFNPDKPSMIRSLPDEGR